MSCATFRSLPWRSRSQHDLAAKLFPAHNFVIWSQISKLFHRHDHHIETMCCAQHLGPYLEGQGHSMIFQQNSFRPITLWFEVEFNNYFTGMITILRQCVACNIWVATLKAKVTAWPFSKILSGPKLYLKSDFTTTFDKLLLCVQYLFVEHFLVPTGSCCILFHYKILLFIYLFTKQLIRRSYTCPFNCTNQLHLYHHSVLNIRLNLKVTIVRTAFCLVAKPNPSAGHNSFVYMHVTVQVNFSMLSATQFPLYACTHLVCGLIISSEMVLMY